jgi:hypothetical protein
MVWGCRVALLHERPEYLRYVSKDVGRWHDGASWDPLPGQLR